MSELTNNIQKPKKQKSSIDYNKIFSDMLRHKRLYKRALSITFLVSVVIALSLPVYYTCVVKLSPELSSTRSSSSLLSLASSFGVNLGNAAGMMGSEALFPTLYPDLMNSVDFKTSLFPVPVTIEGDEEKGIPSRTMSYYDYLSEEQKLPWWSQALKAVFTYIAELFLEEKEPIKEVNPFRLTKKQARIAKSLDRKVVCDVDKKTMVISIVVTDQDPLICATMADSVKNRLQRFITDYRTSKARVDVEYYQKLLVEAKVRYDEARKEYAAFADANQDIILESVRLQMAELENEMQLQYNAYTQISAQLIQAEARLQQETPAFTTLQSASVPVQKAGPGRKNICIMFTFLAFLCVTGYVLHKEGDLRPLLGL